MATTKTILIVGASSSGVYMASNLCSKYNVLLHNSGSDFRNDGVTNNIALAGDTPANSVSLTAAPTAPHPPALSQPWKNMFKLTDYSDSFASLPTGPVSPPAAHTVYVQKNYGGSEETDDGERIMPTTQMLTLYSSSIGSSRFYEYYSNVYRLIVFRCDTVPTSNTYDLTTFAPLPGQSRSDTNTAPGQLSIMQASSSEMATYFTYAFLQIVDPLRYFPDIGSAALVTQNFFNLSNPNFIGVPTQKIGGSYVIGGTTTPDPVYETQVIFASSNKEFALDKFRNRSTFPRTYCTMTVQPKNIKPAPYNSKGWINTGTMSSVLPYKLTTYLNSPVKRIVFATKQGVAGVPANGQDYWLQNYPVSSIKAANFVTPLKVIGYMTGPTMAAGVFVPCDYAVISAGVFGSVALLYQSGIGPAANLAALGIPCLLDLPVGQKVTSRVGFTMKIAANENKVGTVDVGTFPPTLIVDGADANPAKPNRRVRITVAYTGLNTYTAEVTLWRPRSCGVVKGTSTWSPTSLPAVSFDPKYFTAVEDTNDIALAVKNIAKAFHFLDPAVTFQNPNMPYATILSSTSSALLTSLASDPANFVVKNEYFGGASMGSVVAGAPKPVVLNNGAVKGTSNLKIASAAVTPLVTDMVNGVATLVPESDGDATLNDMVFATYYTTTMLASLS